MCFLALNISRDRFEHGTNETFNFSIIKKKSHSNTLLKHKKYIESNKLKTKNEQRATQILFFKFS